MSQRRISHFSYLLGFNIDSLPFIYLGVPIFIGKPKVFTFQPYMDKIRSKLYAWKAFLLSIAGRVQLVKSVILNMIQHNIEIYWWPASLIKFSECLIRHFIWSRDVNKRKLVTVAWHKVCKPTSQSGLGLRSIYQINKGASLKHHLDFMNSS